MSHSQQLQIVIVSASQASASRSRLAAHYARAALQTQPVAVDFLDLNEHALPTYPHAEGSTALAELIHHVANVYPLEIDLAESLAAGKAIAGVGWDGLAQMNTQHAHVNRAETLTVLRQNSKRAAERVRALRDEQLDGAATVSLNADAPLTAQFFIEDYALRHSFHHLANIRAALGR